jgi:CheY-like chemotaxis protein
VRRDLKVIVLSADANPTQIEELRKLGISDYITKPFDIEDLAKRIAETLKA